MAGSAGVILKRYSLILAATLSSATTVALEPGQREMSAEQLAALMEFIGEWEQHENEWLDPMTFESEEDNDKLDPETGNNGKQDNE